MFFLNGALEGKEDVYLEATTDRPTDKDNLKQMRPKQERVEAPEKSGSLRTAAS